MTLIPLIIKAHLLYGLTYREAQVTILVGWGIPHKAIADILGVTQKTVEKFLERIHATLSLSYTTHIAHRLIADGVITPISDWRPYAHQNLKKIFSTLPSHGSGQSINTLRKLILANEQTKD